MNLPLLKELDLPIKCFKTGQTILKKGDNKSKVYILLEGGVSVTVDNHLISKEFTPGTIFGEISSLLNMPNVATVTTVDSSKFYVIDKFLDYLKGNSELAVNISQTLAYRLVFMNEHFVEIKNQINQVQENLKDYMPVFQSDKKSAPKTKRK